VELIAAALGKTPILDRQPDQPGDVPITYADVSLAGRDLGYAPQVPIEQGIARFVDWFRAQPA
jgi:UDP-glucuronate 4-epimerase